MKRPLGLLTAMLVMFIGKSVQAEEHLTRTPGNIVNIIQGIYGSQASVRDVWRYTGFSLGGPSDIGPDESRAAKGHIVTISPDEDGVWIGATDSTSYNPRYSRGSDKMNELYNNDLRSARAAYMNTQTGWQCLPAAQGLSNDVRGAYLVIVKRPPGMATRVPNRYTPIPPASVVQKEVHYYHEGVSHIWFRPSVGLESTILPDVDNDIIRSDFTAPSAALMGGTRWRSLAVGGYVSGSTNMHRENRGSFATGVVIGHLPGQLFRAGYRSAWSEFRGVGFTNQRYQGLEAGLEMYRGPVAFGMTFGRGWYADLTDRPGRQVTHVALVLDVGHLFSWPKYSEVR